MIWNAGANPMFVSTAGDSGSDGQIPGYQLLGFLGKGATTKVYRARETLSDRIVAIKVLPKNLGKNHDYIERFVAGAKSSAAVDHVNVVRTIGVGRTPDGFNYIVTEFVLGRTLFERIAPPPFGGTATFSIANALDICIQIADGLACAHQHGLTHRAVKPKNILLTDMGVAVLTGLGLVRPTDERTAAFTARGAACGIPYYLSPEQIRGEAQIDARADIYSLGATLYHLMTGRPPFGGERPGEVLQQHLSAPLKPAHGENKAVPEGVSRIIDVAMSKRKEDRYQSMAMMLNDLRARQKDL
jgi:eukaryotic-like serine/threonine-protein kinase